MTFSQNNQAGAVNPSAARSTAAVNLPYATLTSTMAVAEQMMIQMADLGRNMRPQQQSRRTHPSLKTPEAVGELR